MYLSCLKSRLNAQNTNKEILFLKDTRHACSRLLTQTSDIIIVALSADSTLAILTGLVAVQVTTSAVEQSSAVLAVARQPVGIERRRRAWLGPGLGLGLGLGLGCAPSGRAAHTGYGMVTSDDVAVRRRKRSPPPSCASTSPSGEPKLP